MIEKRTGKQRTWDTIAAILIVVTTQVLRTLPFLREQLDGTGARKCRSSTGDDHEKGEKDSSADSI
jgi:hypothetical protein